MTTFFNYNREQAKLNVGHATTRQSPLCREYLSHVHIYIIWAARLLLIVAAFWERVFQTNATTIVMWATAWISI